MIKYYNVIGFVHIEKFGYFGFLEIMLCKRNSHPILVGETLRCVVAHIKK